MSFGSIIHPMVIDMNETRLKTVTQLGAFLEGTLEVKFQPIRNDVERYGFIAGVLGRFAYGRLARADKGVLMRYLGRITEYSRAQLKRLVRRHLKGEPLAKRYRAPAEGFARKFTAADVKLLAQTDALHNTLSGPATKCLMQRAYTVYDDARYARLATLSVAHLYNLRHQVGYQATRAHWTKTRGYAVPIGQRRAPTPDGRPGFIRIDSVHQGDQDGAKGLYHINAVDCVTQYEIVATCERLSEAFLLPVLQQILAGFPFVVLGFHADNGSEYINYTVAEMLDKLRIEFTKSRPRHSNDNGLAETKNGAVVRKHFGYEHIPQRFAAQVTYPATLRRPGQHLLPGLPQPLREFPSPLFLCPNAHRFQGKDTQALSAKKHDDALRETQIAAQGQGLPQARDHRRTTGLNRNRHQRQRGRPQTQRSQKQTIPIHPSSIQTCRLNTGYPPGRSPPALEGRAAAPWITLRRTPCTLIPRHPRSGSYLNWN